MPFLGPILDMLHVPAELKIEFKGDTLRLTGMLPCRRAERGDHRRSRRGFGCLSRSIPPALKASPHVKAAPFAKKKALAAFLASFFAAPPPRSFRDSETRPPKAHRHRHTQAGERVAHAAASRDGRPPRWIRSSFCCPRSITMPGYQPTRRSLRHARSAARCAPTA
jgi:hypothetical protein